MKKDVKKMLAEHRADILPDERVKEKVKRDLGLSEVRESRLSYAQGGEHALTDKKKVFIAVVTVLLVAAIFLGVFLPLQLGGGTQPGGVPIIPDDPFGAITSADEFYAYGAASVGSILASSVEAQAGGAAVSAAETASSGISALAAPSDKAQAEILNKYLSLVESLLSDGGISGEAIAPAGKPAGKYEFGMRVTSTDLVGGTSGYILYYNKHFLSGETDGDESEENYSIDGILVTEFDTYEVTGKYQTETESDDGEHESESELSFRAFTSEDKRSYIEVRQEFEAESEDGVEETEVEYVYTVAENDRPVERMTVEYEKEANELELNMTIERGNVREELVFEDETEDGVRVIAVSGTLDGEPVAFRIYIRDGHYDYVFSDGGTVSDDRYDDDDDWFDDDRFDDDDD